MRHKGIAKASTVLASVALATALQGTAANASEGVPLTPNEMTCGITTCTAYWSVDRTAEIHAEWKETITGVGTLGGAGAAFGGALGTTLSTGPAAPIVAGAGVVIAARSLEFNHMINGAENDGRCLIFKYPRHNPTLGWFGSVHLNNENCNRGPA